MLLTWRNSRCYCVIIEYRTESERGMSTALDFEALRSERNRSVMRSMQQIADELDVPVESLRSNYNPDACYCACTSGGPCEHKWDGEPWESADGLGWSTTCSRCGCTSMGHDMRVLP